MKKRAEVQIENPVTTTATFMKPEIVLTPACGCCDHYQSRGVGSLGLCRRYPPKNGEHPAVKKDDVCGEYRHNNLS